MKNTYQWNTEFKHTEYGIEFKKEETHYCLINEIGCLAQKDLHLAVDRLRRFLVEFYVHKEDK